MSVMGAGATCAAAGLSAPCRSPARRKPAAFRNARGAHSEATVQGSISAGCVAPASGAYLGGLACALDDHGEHVLIVAAGARAGDTRRGEAVAALAAGRHVGGGRRGLAVVLSVDHKAVIVVRALVAVGARVRAAREGAAAADPLVAAGFLPLEAELARAGTDPAVQAARERRAGQAAADLHVDARDGVLVDDLVGVLNLHRAAGVWPHAAVGQTTQLGNVLGTLGRRRRPHGRK